MLTKIFLFYKCQIPEKIIQYREENGKFNDIEDVKKVNGIGDVKYEKIKENICVK